MHGAAHIHQLQQHSVPASDSALPFVSVIIPCPPGTTPTKALQSLNYLNYPEGRIEIIIARGTRPSVQRNRAAEAARGELLYFLDDDSEVTPDNLLIAASYLGNPDITGIGGPALTHNQSSLLENCIGMIISTRFGCSSTRARYQALGKARLVRGEELILCNMLFRRSEYLRAAGLKPHLYPNEENEFLKRLRSKGHKFMYIPGLTVHRGRPASIRSFIHQMFRYGHGRAKHIFQKMHARDFHFFIPSLFVLYLPVPLYQQTFPAVIPLLCYCCLALFTATALGAQQRSIKVFLLTAALFPLMHISYGIGLIYGLLTSLSKQKHANSEVLLQQYIREFSLQHAENF